MKFSESNHSKWDDFFLVFEILNFRQINSTQLGFVQTTWVGRLTFINFSVTFVMSCRFLRCCSYMRKAQVKFLICKWMHDPWKRIQIEIKPKTALNLWIWVSLLSKENPQLLPQLKHTHYTFPLDNQRVSAWNITSLCRLSRLCTLL